MPSSFKPSLEPSVDVTPVTKFRGKMKDYRDEEFKNTKGTSVTFFFDFIDIEVIEASEPYKFPTITVRVPYSLRPKTAWDAFKISLGKLTTEKDLDALVNKYQTWAYLPAKGRRPADPDDPSGKWVEADVNSWQIVELDGVSVEGAGRNISDAVLELLDGKNKRDFLKALYDNDELKKMGGYEGIVEGATSGVLLDTMLAANTVTLSEDGTFSVVKN